jgi:hypothetical protein
VSETWQLSRLSPRRIVAWRRPGVVAVYWLYRVLVALLLAGPFAAIAGRVTSGYPRGDATLFDRGGVMLLEAGRVAQPLVSAIAAQTSAIALAAAVIGLVPMAALVVALGHQGRLSLAALLARATERIGTLALLLGVALLLEVVVALASLLLGESLVARLALTEPRADHVRLATAALAVCAVLTVGVLHDLARVAAVHRRIGFYGACVAALSAFRYAGLRALGSYAVRAVLAAAVLAIAVMLVSDLRLERTGSVALAWVVHQAALLAAVACRASWLAAAMRLVELNVAEQREELPQPIEGDRAILLSASDLIFDPPKPGSQPPPRGGA